MIQSSLNRLRSIRGALSAYLDRGLERIWILQVPSSLCLIIFFLWLWKILRADGGPASAYIEYPKILLPVLALTNAIPMLAVSSYLSRFNASSKSRDALAVIYDLIHKNEQILGSHSKYNKYQRIAPISSILNRTGPQHLSFSPPPEEMWFTPRPLWDGVWYYGGDTHPSGPYSLSRRKLHEAVYCAVVMLTLVGEMQHGPGLLRLGRPMTQGSKWFLESFYGANWPSLRQLGHLTDEEALKLIRIAQRSVFYMNDEVQTYQHIISRDEHREASFAVTISDYLIWQLYFNLKLLEIRIIHVFESGGNVDRFDAKASGEYKQIYELREKLLGIRSEMIPYKTVTQRIVNVRSGTIAPILLSAIALLCCILLLPIAQADAGTDASRSVDWFAGGTFALGTAAIAGNILFGLWLLWPPKIGREASLLPR